MNCRVNQAALRNYVEHAEGGRVVVFDTETTGTSNADEIVEIGAAEYVCGERTRTLSVYVNPTCEMNPGAEAVHHLTLPFLREHGVEPREALAMFFDFLGRDALVVGHNIRFDVRMMTNECRKFGFAAEPEGLTFCDTIALAKKLVPGLPHYRLGTLVEALGLEGANTHDALDDTLACGELFFDLVRRVPISPDDYVYEPVFD